MRRLFTIIDTKTGKEPDLEKIALNETWAHGLTCCDMEGFAILDDGSLVLLDECGGYRSCPSGRFIINYSEKHAMRVLGIAGDTLLDRIREDLERGLLTVKGGAE